MQKIKHKETHMDMDLFFVYMPPSFSDLKAPLSSSSSLNLDSKFEFYMLLSENPNAMKSPIFFTTVVDIFFTRRPTYPNYLVNGILTYCRCNSGGLRSEYITYKSKYLD